MRVLQQMQHNYVEKVKETQEIATIDQKIKQLELREQNLADALKNLDEKMRIMKTHFQELNE